MTERLTLTVREAAAATGIGRNRLYELVRTGEIPAVRVGRNVRIPRDALVRWLDDAARQRRVV